MVEKTMEEIKLDSMNAIGQDVKQIKADVSSIAKENSLISASLGKIEIFVQERLKLIDERFLRQAEQIAEIKTTVKNHDTVINQMEVIKSDIKDLKEDFEKKWNDEDKRRSTEETKKGLALDNRNRQLDRKVNIIAVSLSAFIGLLAILVSVMLWLLSR